MAYFRLNASAASSCAGFARARVARMSSGALGGGSSWVLVSHMPLADSLFHLNKCANTTLVRIHRVKEVVYKVSLTPTLQRQQQRRNAAPLYIAALAGTLPKGVLDPYRGRVCV